MQFPLIVAGVQSFLDVRRQKGIDRAYDGAKRAVCLMAQGFDRRLTPAQEIASEEKSGIKDEEITLGWVAQCLPPDPTQLPGIGSDTYLQAQGRSYIAGGLYGVIQYLE